MERLKRARRRLKARKFRIRKKVRGVTARPRVSVHFSNRSVFAQVIDDDAGKTLVSVSSLGKEAAVKGKGRSAAKELGALLAEKAKSAGVTIAVFDRNGRKYHGRVKEFADAMREKGIVL